jgi:hypothetical protein
VTAQIIRPAYSPSVVCCGSLLYAVVAKPESPSNTQVKPRSDILQAIVSLRVVGLEPSPGASPKRQPGEVLIPLIQSKTKTVLYQVKEQFLMRDWLIFCS